MFKNRAIQIDFVKKANEDATDKDPKNPIVNDETAAIAKDIIKHLGVAVVAVSGAIITLKTIGDIAIVKTKAATKNK